MPTGVSDSCVKIRLDRETICGYGSGSLDDEPARGVVEAEEVQFGAGFGVENVGERHRCWDGEVRDARCLYSDVKGVFEESWREHVTYEFSRNCADTDLTRGKKLPIGTDQTAGLNVDFERGSLLGREVRRGNDINSDRGDTRVADRLEDGRLDAR